MIILDERSIHSISEVLKSAKADGEAVIRAMDGAEYTVFPRAAKRSPLDVKGVETDIKVDEIVAAVRQGRERGYDQKDQ